MKLIPLTKGKFARVDDWWFDELNKYKWHYDGDYARRNIYHYESGKKIQKHILMHRVIASTPDGKFTDHIDGDTLNNQASNLRVCTTRQNVANMKKRSNQSSIYKGVTKRGNSYRTVIWKDNEKAFDVSCTNERWAAYMYDLNASALFGEFFRPNFPEAILVVQE